MCACVDAAGIQASLPPACAPLQDLLMEVAVDNSSIMGRISSIMTSVPMGTVLKKFFPSVGAYMVALHGAYAVRQAGIPYA